ncbi:hypothetical protein Taro_046021, partial [Colocasia esculenta]|nr:hypothetical protein [Colocasia esculenta]
IYSGGPLASLSEAVVHNLFDHSPLGHDIFGHGGLGVYAPARLLDRIDGIVVDRGFLRVDIGQVALLMSSPSILVCRRHLAAWLICPCLLTSLRQEIGHFSLPTLYEIILGVVRHRLEGSPGWRHEEYFGLLSIRRKKLVPELETHDFIFFSSFEVSLALAREWSLFVLERKLKSLPLVRRSSLIALLALERSSGRIPGIPEDSFVFLARFIYPEHSSGDAKWPSRFPPRSIANLLRASGCGTLPGSGLWGRGGGGIGKTGLRRGVGAEGGDVFKMPQRRGYLSCNDYAQRTRDKVVLLDDMMPSLGEPRVTSTNSPLLDSRNNNVAEVNSDNLLAIGGVDISRISRLKGAYHYTREEDYPAYLPTDPELFNFIQNFVPSHMTANDPCLSAERRYLESAILKSRDSLFGTCASSYPSFPLGFAVQQRLPPIADLGPFSHDLNSYTRSRKISPAVWSLTNRHQTKPETDGLQLMPCDTRYISGGYCNRCLLNRIVDLTSPSWYGSWSVLPSRVFHFGATEWLMGILHHYGKILKLSDIYEAVEAALYDYPCHTGLLQALVERFNARWNTFGTAEGETSIDLWSFHRISGLPISGGFYEEVVLDDLHTYRSNGAGQHILPYSLRFLTKVWRDLALIGRKDDPDSPLSNLRVSQNAWLRYFYNGPFCFFDNFATEGRHLEEYNQLNVRKPHHGRYIFAPENTGWNPRRLPDRTYLAAYLVYWLSSFVIPYGEEELIRPGLIYHACLLAEGHKFAIAPAALANIFHGLGSLSSHSSPRDRKTLLPTHYLSAWAGLLLPGLCQIVDLPRPTAPLILLFRNRPCEDLVTQLTGARYSLSFLPNGEQYLLQFGLMSRGVRPYSVQTSDGVTYHLPHSRSFGPLLYKDWLLCIRPSVLVYRRGSSLVLEPYYPSSFPLGFAVQQRLPPIADLGPFSHDLNSYTRSRKISPAVWSLTNRHQTKPETDGLQLMPCDTRYISGGYDNRCPLNRIVDLTSPSWYGSWSVLPSRVFHFGATEWLMGILHHYEKILKLSDIYEVVEAALYDYPCHTGLLQALVERFNARWNTFGTAEGETSIDLWSFHRISGLPISGGFYEEVVLDDLHTYRSNGAGQYILPYSLRFLTKSVPPNAEFPLAVRLFHDHCLHMNAASWWNYFCREEMDSTCIFPSPETTGRIDLFYARWWFDRSNIFRLVPAKLRKFEESRLKKKGLPLILVNVEFLKAHFRGLMRSYLKRYNSITSRKSKSDSSRQYYQGEMPLLEPIELFGKKTMDIHGWVRWERHLTIAIGHAGPLEFLPCLENARTLYDIDEEDNALDLSDEEGSLPEGSPPIHREEYGSTSQASVGILPENAYHEVPPNFEFSEIAAGDNNPRFTFAKLGVSSGQYSSVPNEVYIPLPVEEPTVAAEAPFGQELYEQLFAAGTIDMCPTLAADPFLSPWGNAENSFFRQQAHSAFQVDGVASYSEECPETAEPMNYNVDPSASPPRSFVPHPVDFPSSSQGFYSGDRGFVQPSNPGTENRERNPSPGFVNSPALEIGALSEHNITWPTEARPNSSSDDEDNSVWNHLVGKVQKVDKAYSLHVDVTWAPYRQRLQVLEGDICSLSSDIDESDSRVADVRKRRKTRELRMATRGENIARLERELGKERSSQARDARDEARDSEEEAVLIRGGDDSRRFRSLKVKEAERLKRRQPSCLCFPS